MITTSSNNAQETHLCPQENLVTPIDRIDGRYVQCRWCRRVFVCLGRFSNEKEQP